MIRIASSLNNFSPAWRARLLLALALIFGSEVLLWTDPTGRLPGDWIPLIVGYVATAALLLDLAARFRVRNLFGLLALAGIYGLLNGLLLNPDTALVDVPRTLFTRVLGAHSFAGLLMLWLFLWLTTGKRLPSWLLGVGGAVIGFGWGTWARWAATLLRPDAADAPLASLLLAVVVVVVLSVGLLKWQREAAPAALRLKPLEWIGVIVVLTALLVVWTLAGVITTLSLSLCAVLLAFCVALLWFLKRQKGATVLDGMGEHTVRWIPYLAMVVLFVLAGVAGYGLPRGEGAGDPVFVITTILTAFGIVWLPGVSLALGAQAFTRQVRAGKL